jgi:hypothetical protein
VSLYVSDPKRLRSSSGHGVVYYKSIKRELKKRCIYECRCDERLQTKTKEFTPSGHGVGWRTGVDFQDAGSFTHSVKFLSCPWGRDPWGTRRVCELSVFLPTALYALRLSVGAGLFTHHLFD